MKKLLTFASVAALAAGSALAADLPSRKAPPMLPPPPPPPMWTGFYAGLNAGYGFGTNSNTQNASIAMAPYNIYGGGYRGDSAAQIICLDSRCGPSGSGIAGLGAGLALSGYGPMTQSGFIGGGQIGYNYQYGQSFVLGIEADMQGTGIRGTSFGAGIGSDSGLYNSFYDKGYINQSFESTATGATRVNAGVDWMGTVRGRVGYLFTPTMLLYATGGLTYGGVYANVTQFAVANTNYYTEGKDRYLDGGVSHTFIGGGNKSQTLVGWNVGGGIEWMFMPNWSLKAEGIYWNMGNMNVPTSAFAVAPVSLSSFGGREALSIDRRVQPPFVSNGVGAIGGTRVNYQGVIARVGVNYHFNWFAPAPVVAKY